MTNHNPHLTYRPDIDGLRAIAILAVLIYHAFPTRLAGGFIGVDIFFVISGYLISSILLKDLNQNRFSLLGFYIRRANRIFPALIVVFLSIFAVGWFVLLPDELASLGKYMAAGAGFVANLALWKDLGYFDTAADYKPLLHLWSLGVEEQFYFVWPLMLWLGFKRRWNLLTLTVGVSLVSYYLSLRGVKTNASAAFYLPHTRFWELCLGALVAVCHTPQIKLSKSPVLAALTHVVTKIDTALHHIVYRSDTPQTPFKALRQTSSVLGLGLILYGMAHLSKSMPFPGRNALWPTLGAVLLIAAGREAFINRHFLSNKVMVWIGLISYPLYLWHWPLLSLARIVEQDLPSRNIRLAALILSVVLATATFYCLEKPLRKVKALGKKAAILFGLLMLTGYLGWNTHQRDGYGFRGGLQKSSVTNEYAKQYFGSTQESNIFPVHTLPGKEGVCDFARLIDSQNNGLLILGDSHAGHLSYGFAQAYPKLNINVGRFGIPLLKTDVTSMRVFPKEFDYLSSDYLGKQSTVLLSAWWPLYGSTYPSASYGRLESPINYEGKSYPIKDLAWAEPALRQTFDYLLTQGKSVIFTHDIPVLKYKPTDCFIQRPFKLTGKSISCDQNKADIVAEHQAFRSIAERVLKDYPSIKVFDPLTFMCDEHICHATKNGKSLYLDDNHLSMFGSEEYGKAFKAAFPDLFKPEQ